MSLRFQIRVITQYLHVHLEKAISEQNENL